MIGLNSTYIYFLAIKKIFIRSLNEFFFSSNYYNKLLDTEVPSSFLFNPNPYLLSPFVSHKDSLIKISHEDVRNFKIVNDIAKQFDVVIPLAGLVGAPLCDLHPIDAVKINQTAVEELCNTLSKETPSGSLIKSK